MHEEQKRSEPGEAWAFGHWLSCRWDSATAQSVRIAFASDSLLCTPISLAISQQKWSYLPVLGSLANRCGID